MPNFFSPQNQGTPTSAWPRACLPWDPPGLLAFQLFDGHGVCNPILAPPPSSSSDAQSLLVRVFKVHFKCGVSVACIVLQTACRLVLAVGNGFASCFAWPRSSLAVSPTGPFSFSLAWPPLFASCDLMVGSIFQTLTP